jgi:hypothetical protein
MDDNHEGRTDSATNGPARRAKRGTTAIKLWPPQVVPISDEDYQQAVTALAPMITSRWREQQHDQSE